MSRISSSHFLSLAAYTLFVWIAGCDSVDVGSVDRQEPVHPTVAVHFVNGDLEVAKSLDGQAIVSVALTVVSESGRDYSPEPISVDDATNESASFELSLPPDSVFSFTAELRRNGELVAEGRVLQLVTAESSEISLPVVITNGDPFFAVFPAAIEVGASATTMDMEMRLYGNRGGIVGLAVEMLQTGSDTEPVSFDGVDVVETIGNKTSLGWQFDGSGTPLNLGTIEVPVDEAADFCLDIEEGAVKTVTAGGQISIIGGSGACVHVIQ